MAENEKPKKRKPRVKKSDNNSDKSTKKPATKKPATKKPATKKPATKKPATKKPATKKPATKKPATKKPATKKPATKKSEILRDINTKTPLSKVDNEPLNKEVTEITTKMASKQHGTSAKGTPNVQGEKSLESSCCGTQGVKQGMFMKLINWIKRIFK